MSTAITPALSLLRLRFQQETLLSEIVKRAQEYCDEHGNFEAAKSMLTFAVWEAADADDRDKFVLSLQALSPIGKGKSPQVLTGIRQTRTGWQYDGVKGAVYTLAHAVAYADLFPVHLRSSVRVGVTKERGFYLLANSIKPEAFTR